MLIAEDEPELLSITAETLQEWGVDVEKAVNGQEALQKVKASSKAYDLVLMDMHMPELDGYEATAEIRKLGFKGPIIALTARVLDSERQRCVDFGCNDFLSKPVSFQDLRAMLEKHAEKKISP